MSCLSQKYKGQIFVIHMMASKQERSVGLQKQMDEKKCESEQMSDNLMNRGRRLVRVS